MSAPPAGARVGLEAVGRVREALTPTFDTSALSSAPQTLARFARDESDLGDFPPDLVVFPEDTAQVAAVVRACGAHRVPFVAVGARTGKSGGTLFLRGGVAVSLERMNRVLSVSAEDLVAVVQPGVVLEDLKREVDERGLFYPPDPNSVGTCTLGGNVAENAGGPSALKYGVTRDYVLGLEWVLPTGEVLRAGRRTAKGVAGYDVVGLLVGSEGTLGIATEITLRLLPRPKAIRTALLSFRAVAEAAAAVTRVLQGGCLPRALELLDDVALAAVAGEGVAFPTGAGAVLLIELDGSSDDGVLAELEGVVAVCTAAGALETQVAQSDAQREALWRVRRLVSPGLRRLKGRKLSEDIVVPRSRIPEAIVRFKAIGASVGLTVATYGHAGDGNLHTNVLFDGPGQQALVDLALDGIIRATLDLGGTITGEHGVGLAKKRFLPLEQSPALLALQGRLRAAFDPHALSNPGKIFLDPEAQ